MKFLLAVIFLLFSSFSIAQSDVSVTCPTPGTTRPFDLENYKAYNAILNSLSLSLKDKQNAMNDLNIKNAKKFLSDLPANERKEINDLFETIRQNKSPLNRLPGDSGSPLLLVNGLDYNEFPQEWVIPFHKLLKEKQTTYFFKWSKFKSIEANTTDLVATIKSILADYPEKHLTMVGYSAGGILAMQAMDILYNDPDSKRISFSTVAAPLFGYKAPSYVVVAAPLFGLTSLQIGVGRYNSLKNKKLLQCNHWVNTNCELDPHTCAADGLNPQLGPQDAKDSLLPCGAGHIKSYNDEGHASILDRALDEIKADIKS